MRQRDDRRGKSQSFSPTNVHANSTLQALIKGISGGQRKRTSVGVEIITDPDVSFENLSLHIIDAT